MEALSRPGSALVHFIDHTRELRKSRAGEDSRRHPFPKRYIRRYRQSSSSFNLTPNVYASYHFVTHSFHTLSLKYANIPIPLFYLNIWRPLHLVTDMRFGRVSRREIPYELNETVVKRTPFARSTLIFFQRLHEGSDPSPASHFLGFETRIF